MRRIYFVILGYLLCTLLMAQNPSDAAVQTDDTTPIYSSELVQKAMSGDVDAQLNLGLMYDNGQGVVQNYKEAFHWHQKAAEQGESSAQISLGLFYYDGKGVKQDYKEAVKWFKLAAEQGDTSAQYNLGLAYYQGKGVVVDYKKAYFWILLARANGDKDIFEHGHIAIDEIEKKLSPAQMELIQERASKWFSEHQ